MTAAADTGPGSADAGPGAALGPSAPGDGVVLGEGAIARIAVEVEPFHLDRPFDYLVPDDLRGRVRPGQRVQVGFSGRSRRGLVLEVLDRSDVDPARLRPLKKLLGEHVWATPEDVALLRWAADRFAAPLGDVLRHALPGRTVAVERRGVEQGWLDEDPARWHEVTAPADVLGDDPAVRREVPVAWRGHDGAAELFAAAAERTGRSAYWRPLPGEDVGARLAELASRVLAAGRGVLVLVPDPASFTADVLVSTLEEAGHEVVDVRGGPSPRVQYDRWLRARSGRARVVVGERGAAFWPVADLGLAVAVDEANPAFKERRSPRHHAREVVLERARRAGAVGLLVGLVPSAPAWRLLAERRLATVIPRREDERRAAPLVTVADERGGPRTRISHDALRAIRAAVAEGRHAVVLAARRGEGRALVCRSCGARVACPDCGGSTEAAGRRLRCGSCGWDGIRRCRSCSGEALVPLAAGAHRLAEELARTVDVPVRVLEGYAPDEVPAPPAVLVATRGAVLDHPPGPVGAVVLADLDGLLRRPVLDAAEDALRLAMQLATWTTFEVVDEQAGEPGARPASRDATARVVVQTREPDHPVVRALVAWDPKAFWTSEAAMRSVLRFPPAAHAIALDAPAGVDVATELRRALPPGDDVLGPLPDGDRQRLLLKADDRSATLRALAPLREAHSRADVDLRVDVDPVQVG